MVIIFIFLALCTAVLAATPAYRTIEYRGVASINGTPVPDGTVISIWANNDTLQMDSVTTQFGIGYYDHLELIWDDVNTTGTDEGVYPDETTLEKITFKIGNLNATIPPYVTVKLSERGALNYLDLDTNQSINDTGGPIIALLSPVNDSSDDDGIVIFQYNVTDAASGIQNCSLVLNGEINQTSTTVTENTVQSFSQTLVNGEYNWSITCTDNSINFNANSSETRKFKVNITAYNVTVIPWDALISGKPTGVNVTVRHLNGTGVYNATVEATEINGYTPFALSQRIDSNVTSISTARTHTDQNGFVMFTIVPTGGYALLGYETYVGNYSITVNVKVNDLLVNSTLLNNTQRQLLDATGVIGNVPSKSDINYFKSFIAVVYDKILDWVI